MLVVLAVQMLAAAEDAFAARQLIACRIRRGELCDDALLRLCSERFVGIEQQHPVVVRLTVARASSIDRAMTTPLPAARPSALRTTGASKSSSALSASASFVTV